MHRGLTTTRLNLIQGTENALRADLESRAALAGALGIAVPASWPPELYDADAIRWTLTWLERHPNEQEWGFYYVALREPNDQCVLIGCCGYKGGPSLDGMVEIGYGILAEYRRQGYASEAANALVAAAFADPRVQEVMAHTLPELIPSIGVLRRCGFTFVGPGTDPTEPTAIRFVLTRGQYEQKQQS